MKCLESEDEPVSTTSETFYQLSCFIEKGLLSKLIRVIHVVVFHNIACLIDARLFISGWQFNMCLVVM